MLYSTKAQWDKSDGSGNPCPVEEAYLEVHYSTNGVLPLEPHVDNVVETVTFNEEVRPETVNDTIIISYLMINLLAGAETTAVPLRSVFYYILQQPAVWARLRQGLDTIVKDKIKPVTWRDARLSPYLEVVMREATRMLPGVAMNLERYVPEGGLVIPPVPTSGGNRNDAPAAVAENGIIRRRRRRVLARALAGGGGAGAAVPCTTDSNERGGPAFGAGARVCIGKNLALLQAYEAVATLVVRYDIELAEPTSQWRITNSWFPRQEDGLDGRLNGRAGGH
ncbi:cytochrome P450 [Apiospora kogelbergensis]|uniref:cytochrome P450 n=1 Tax=Apiospora kogelbergensis TaxID=1337665 RepID=UPI00312DCC85